MYVQLLTELYKWSYACTIQEWTRGCRNKLMNIVVISLLALIYSLLAYKAMFYLVD